MRDVANATPERGMSGSRVLLVVGGAFAAYLAVLERHATEHELLASSVSICWIVRSDRGKFDVTARITAGCN